MSDKYALIAAEYAANMAAPGLMLRPHEDVPVDWRIEIRLLRMERRPLSATAERQEYLKGKIGEIFDDNDETYGYRRVHAELARQGEQATSELVRRLSATWAWCPARSASPGR